MDIRVLQEFVVLSRHLKVSSAASELFMAAPTLSQHISALEKELGIMIFDRKGGLTLTPEGEEALEIAQNILGEHGRFSALATQRSQRMRLRIPNYAVGLGELLQAKPSFLEEHPSCAAIIETNELQLEDPFAILREGKSDVAVVYLYSKSRKTIEDYAPDDQQFASFHFRTMNTIFESSPEHPLARKDILCAQDFDGKTILTTLCPLSTILNDSYDFFGEQGVAARTIYRHLTRHDDIFATDLKDYLVSRWAEVPTAMAYENVPRHRYDLDFDLTVEAHFVYIPERLTPLQIAYLETVRHLCAASSL